MKKGDHVIINGMKAEIIEIKWNMARIQYFEKLNIHWVPLEHLKSIKEK